MLNKLLNKLTYKPDTIFLYSAGISDVGKKRDHNEDSYLIDERLGLFVVADGMGGHEAGEVASKLAIETILNHLKKLDITYKQLSSKGNNNSTMVISSLLQDAVEDANNQTHCYNLAKGLPEGKGMGTTLTGFLISSLNTSGKKQIYSFNVGDSRTYSFRKGHLKQLSTDHSHYQLWLETGKEGPAPKHNIIYKAIGPWKRVVAEQHTFSIHTNELFLLCSDGLSDMLSNKDIQEILKTHSKKTLKEIAQVLVDAANEAGGKDNITVILVKP
ncbi:MAG: protein phosphatase 2C domain-containing protein [gamma proteobacterium symbiont of Bathyaustriella thionipta]|nr:protein phosphatase 2C domain-containing protein [gamma proteobacterium symbiont of Bathyaustriella thionipta]MCU7950163.1 protein phosphatase 2C domain-containing protein [gamma proteobacterium symbiont of Bathyaustriella thionipta]MCU7953761.1 protein phosphatase 2C domain-containing protein [gamma proteobacterium symbiont of Bathyaustriella thionipta]MCU7956777.1 protein phosphatase 2C domain-containing protein [gamma proteobacterium symbiont of Bathyaustriella thionipta]MCU7967488.1 prot